LSIHHFDDKRGYAGTVCNNDTGTSEWIDNEEKCFFGEYDDLSGKVSYYKFGPP